MDLGLKGKRAIVCAASKGLGKACAMALAHEGVHVTINARTAETLGATGQEIAKETGVEVGVVPGDVATEEGRAALLRAEPNPDILINNAGGPPPGDFRDWERDQWIAALDANMLAPSALIKAVGDGMIDRGFGRVVNITSAAVLWPGQRFISAIGARTGLTGFCAGLSRQVAKGGVTINNLAPGPFETDRLYATLAGAAKAAGTDVDTVATQRRSSNPTRRFGDPAEFGAACAFLCSQHAGFIVGQTIVMDGGAFTGTL